MQSNTISNLSLTTALSVIETDLTPISNINLLVSGDTQGNVKLWNVNAKL